MHMQWVWFRTREMARLFTHLLSFMTSVFFLLPGTVATWHDYVATSADHIKASPCPMQDNLHAAVVNVWLEGTGLPTLGWCGFILPAIEVFLVFEVFIGTWLCFKICRREQTTLITPHNSPFKHAHKDSNTGEETSESTSPLKSLSPKAILQKLSAPFKQKPLVPPPPNPELVKAASLRKKGGQPPPSTATQQTTQQTSGAGSEERVDAEKVVRECVAGRYEFEGLCCDMGSRMHKFAMCGKTGETKLLFTISPISKMCTLKFPKSISTLNKLLECLSQECPYIHPIKEVIYSQDTQQLVLVQTFTAGSLKDVIYRAKPDRPWEKKYSRRSPGLSSDKVALYGRQILEALLYLYDKGFPPLGHVQSGNVFVEADGDGNKVCKLGGYDNTLLGYKSRLYRRFKDHLELIDVLMFGHLLFEMAAGYEFTEIEPTEDDYKQLATKTKILPEIIFIFSQAKIGNFPTIKDIHKRQFFKSEAVKPMHQGSADPPEKDLLKLLQTVCSKKPAVNKARTAKPKSKQKPQEKANRQFTSSAKPADSVTEPQPSASLPVEYLLLQSRERSSSLSSISKLEGDSKLQALKDDVKGLGKELKAGAKTARKAVKEKVQSLGNDLREKLNHAPFNKAWKNSQKEALKQSISLGDLSSAQK